VALPGYPPADHLLADLGMVTEVTSETTARARTRATPQVAAADGGVRAGVLSTLVDMVGGAIAARVLRPDWMATADLALELVGPLCGPWVEARGSLLRRGRTTLVVEAVVVGVDENGDDIVVAGKFPDPVAWASMTFAVLPAQDTVTANRPAPELPTRWAIEGGGLAVPVMDALPVTVLDGPSGQLSLPVRPYLHNSFGAVQGGVIALVAEAAGVEALGAALGRHSSDIVVTDLQIAYLALGKVGPIVSSVRVLATGSGGRTGAVVELRDAGARNRLCSVINVTGVPVGLLVGEVR
jgi:acyl-coenzyme A thioesterase PaaI-like protein